MLALIPPPDMGDGSNEEEIMSNYININLQEISIPKNVKNIGLGAFMMCPGLTNIEFEEDSNLNSIGMYTFTCCSSLKAINLEDTKLEEIGMVAFASVAGSMPAPAIEEITLPSTLKTIGMGAFMGCTSLRTVNFEDNSQLTSIGDSAFTACSSLTSITILEGVTSIGSSAFEDCSSLTSVTIPKSVTSIGSSAFEDCSSLTSITIPSNVTSIGNYAFRDCYKLVEVYDLTGSEGLKITKGSTGNGHVGYYAVEIKKEEGVTGIYYTGDNNEFVMYKDLNGNHYLVDYQGQGGNISLPTFDDRTYSIKSYAFYENLTITSIEISSSVTSIGEYAFYYCHMLVEVYDLTGSEGLNITAGSEDNGYVGYYADYVYTDINTPLVQKAVEDYTFYYNNNIMYLLSYTGSEKELKLPSIDEVKKVFGDFGVTYEIREYAFYENTNITSVVIPEGVTSIGSYAFYNCSSLETVGFKENSTLTSIGEEAFYRCNSLTSITIPDSVTSIERFAFEGCSNLTIYCEVKSKPSAWHTWWNWSDRPVYWAGEWEYDSETGEPRPIE